MPLPPSAEPTKAPVPVEPEAKPEPVALSELAKQADTDAAPPPDPEAVLEKKAGRRG